MAEMTLLEKVKGLCNLKTNELDNAINICTDVVEARVRKYINCVDDELPILLVNGVLPCIISDFVMCTVPYLDYRHNEDETKGNNIKAITENDRKVEYDMKGIFNGKAIDDIMSHYATDLNQYRRISIPSCKGL